MDGITSTIRRAVLRSFWIVLGLACALSPLLIVIGLWHLYLRPLDFLFNEYTGLADFYVMTSRGPQPYLPYYVKRTLIETIVRTYNIRYTALFLAALAAALSLTLHGMSSRVSLFRKSSEWKQVAVLFALIAPACWLLSVPMAPLLALLISAAFALNFPLAGWTVHCCKTKRLRWLPIIGLLAVPCLAHLLAPTACLILLAWCVRPFSMRLRSVALFAGRFLACTCSVPILFAAFLSLRPVPLSPQATALLSTRDLYDVEVDAPGNQVLVTTKQNGTGYAFRLDNPTTPPRKFQAATIELEDIAMDTQQREFYYVDRATGKIVASDADTFRILRIGQISRELSGSTMPVLLRRLNLLFVVWENGSVCLIDRNTLRVNHILPSDPGLTPLEDEENEVFYIVHNFEALVQTFDPKLLRVVARAQGPSIGEKMVLSGQRHELYVPCPRESQIRVYSTPDLRPLYEIPTQFGVRAIAVDEQHELLLAASVITGYVDVIDLNTKQTIQHHYVGKYGRVMDLDTARRHAYITITKQGLYLLEY